MVVDTQVTGHVIQKDEEDSHIYATNLVIY